MSSSKQSSIDKPVTRNLKHRWSLAGKTAVVTGAAGGIGAATACALAARGCNVVLVDIDADAAEAARRQVEAAAATSGALVLALPADVSELSQIEGVLQRTIETFGDVHILMNNAGILRVGPALEVSDEAWQQVINVNLWGVIHGCRVFGKHFKSKGGGHIVNTASAAGLSGLPYSASYATSKFAVVGLSESLRWEFAQFGVGVTVICPGAVKTGIAKGSGGPRTAELVERYGLSVEPLAKRVVQAIERDKARVLYGLEPNMWGALRWVSPSLHDRAGKALARMRHDKQLF
jgi:NAD(P)-dependent dehydrogenase (short-subunit alcohol dehydrogenase family)